MHEDLVAQALSQRPACEEQADIAAAVIAMLAVRAGLSSGGSAASSVGLDAPGTLNVCRARAEAMRKRLGPKDPDTGRCLESLASMLRSAGGLEEATALCQDGAGCAGRRPVERRQSQWP